MSISNTETIISPFIASDIIPRNINIPQKTMIGDVAKSSFSKLANSSQKIPSSSDRLNQSESNAIAPENISNLISETVGDFNPEGIAPENISNLISETGQSITNALEKNDLPNLADSEISPSNLTRRIIPSSKNLPLTNLSNVVSQNSQNPISDPPKSWSNISELLNMPSNSIDSPLSQPPLENSKSEYGFTPMEFLRSQKSPEKESDHQYSVDDHHFSENSQTPEVETSADNSDSIDYLEILAHEIYNCIRDRIIIDRERAGKYYSTRY